MNIVIVSGGFDPLHGGHIKYLEAAERLGDWLFVGVNSDAWLVRKKGNYFLPYEQRSEIIKNLRMVDAVFSFDDTDGTALNLLKKIRSVFKEDHLIIANGGDRNELNNAEAAFEDDNYEFVYGVGGSDKYDSSSMILERWVKFAEYS